MGAIAVVRITGRGVESFLAKHFSKPTSSGKCVHGTLSDGNRVIDDPVVVLSDDQSFADINLHGGAWVVQECLALARRAGFNIVEAGLDLIESHDEIEREMLAALPEARTEQAMRILLAQPRLWTELLNDPDENLRLARTKRMLDERGLWWMLHPPTIAIVGIPNVGKSTIANCLFGQQRSITADVPGTTRDWVGDWANIDGLPVHLLDTPGQRESADPIERDAIARSQSEIEHADLVIVVVDPTQPQPEQRALVARYPKALVVINKTDLPGVWDARPIDGVRMIATTCAGADDLRLAIRSRFDCADMSIQRPRWWTQRQRDELMHSLPI
jgi:small GTP-binding protein